MNTLFSDTKTDEEKATFFLSGRGYETGVIAHSIQNDVAMAYHRCAEYKKELAALQAENERLREALRGWWMSRRPVGWTEDQHRSCPHVNLVTNAEKALADAMLRARESVPPTKEN